MATALPANEWWDPQEEAMVTSVEDDDTKFAGSLREQERVPRRTIFWPTHIGDELKLATQGKSRVFGVSLKDRAAMLPAGFAGRCRLLDRPQEWCLGHLDLLPRRRCPNGRRISTPAVLQNIGIANGRIRKGTVLRIDRHRKSKDGSDAAFYDSSAPPRSATNMNSNSPRN